MPVLLKFVLLLNTLMASTGLVAVLLSAMTALNKLKGEIVTHDDAQSASRNIKYTGVAIGICVVAVVTLVYVITSYAEQ